MKIFNSLVNEFSWCEFRNSIFCFALCLGFDVFIWGLVG